MDRQQLPVPPIVTTRLQSQNFEREWEPHDPDFHPAALKLHVERRAKNAKVCMPQVPLCQGSKGSKASFGLMTM